MKYMDDNTKAKVVRRLKLLEGQVRGLQKMVENDTYCIDAGKELVKSIEPGDVIYVKGSQSMRMERAIAMILAKNHQSQDVLVRQEGEWLKRK
jgi:UDP-N-acetylmuramyl pentapeptide synthase